MIMAVDNIFLAAIEVLSFYFQSSPDFEDSFEILFIYISQMKIIKLLLSGLAHTAFDYV